MFRKSSSVQHEKSSGTDGKQEALFLFTLVALCFILFFLFLGDRPLWDIDEGTHAATSKDMILTGDWVTPRSNGEVFFDKPPLFNWLVALSFLILGFTEFAARLPAAFLGLGCVLFTYFLGRQMFNPLTGLLGGLILATGGEFIGLSIAVVHDMLLTFCITATLYFFYRGFIDQTRRKTFILLFYTFAGFGVLAKGPIGLLLPALIIGFFLLYKQNLGFVKELVRGWGIPLFLLISLPWYILIAMRDQEYLGYFFIQQNLNNFFAFQESRHPEPFYYYIPTLLGVFFPWSLFLPVTFVHCFRKKLGEMGDEKVFLLIWFATIFLFFSVASSKLPTYLLPSFPPLALLVAFTWHDLITNPNRELRRGILFSIVALFVTLSCGLFYLQVFPPTRLTVKFGVDLSLFSYLVIFMMGCTLLSLLFYVKMWYRTSFSSLVGLIALGFIFSLVTIVPAVNPYRSTQKLGRELDTILPPGEKLVFYRRLKDSTLFYTNRQAKVLNKEGFLEYLSSDSRVFGIATRRHLEKLERIVGKIESLYIVNQEGNTVLLSNRPSS